MQTEETKKLIRQMRNVMIKNVKNKKLRPQSLARISDVIGLSRQQIWNILYKKPRYDFSGIKLKGRDFLKEKCRIMDNHTCQVCGKKQNSRRLDVIHIGKEKCINCKNLAHYRSMCHGCKVKVK